MIEKMTSINSVNKNDWFNIHSHNTATLDRDIKVFTVKGFPVFPKSLNIETSPVYLQKVLCETAITSSTGNNPILVDILDTKTTGDLSGELGSSLFGLVINGSNNSLTSKNIDFPGMGLFFKNGLGLYCQHTGTISGFVRTSFFYRSR
jgi:hypothetical protein